MAGVRESIVIGLAVGVGIGVGLAVLAPSVFPHAARAARPMAKRAAKSAMRAYMRTREGLAEFGEYAEDVMAEAQSEVVQERQAAAAAGFAAEAPPSDEAKA
ncbi:MAG: DUF5132 domain-containing protein [Rhodospirillaceae bacterium]|nr:DUF5132 domain-containing protein [Rhodospirillaceae bacterium]|tara:strand:+ start:128 stop:433 length:306 start_codon:yes stop_codon:yes gene_type:complete